MTCNIESKGSDLTSFSRQRASGETVDIPVVWTRVNIVNGGSKRLLHG